MDWSPMIEECAPQVALSTMRAVIRTESGFNPIAINVNGEKRLSRQPKSREEAISWARWLIKRGYSVDLGLMQINSANLARLDLNTINVFDPCLNLQGGARILAENYSRAIRRTSDSRVALLQAISAYNTGNFQHGFRNGYVGRVIQASTVTPGVKEKVPPLRGHDTFRKESAARKPEARSVDARQVETEKVKLQWEPMRVSPHAAKTAVEGFQDPLKSGETF